MYAVVNLEGRVVNTPEYRVGKGDREFCSFRLAVNQQLGVQENTSFYQCTGNEMIASRIRKAGVEKGKLIHITGRLTIREYQTKNGELRTSVDVGILDWNYVWTKPKDEEADTMSTRQPQGRLKDETYLEAEDDLPL